MKKEKVVKGFWIAGNIALPLAEGRWILKAGAYALTRQRARLKALNQQRQEQESREQSFDSAVAESGMTVALLTARYRLRRQLWRALALLPLVMSLLLTGAAVHNGLAYSTLLWRLLSLDFMLLAFGTFCVVKAVQCQYRLWQLHTRTLGTFSAWRQQTCWLKDTLCANTQHTEKS